MKPITKDAWDRVHQTALNIVNASVMEDEILGEIHRVQMHDVLDDLEAEFGPHPEFPGTRAYYVKDVAECDHLLQLGLQRAREQGDAREEREILDSIREFAEEDDGS